QPRRMAPFEKSLYWKPYRKLVAAITNSILQKQIPVIFWIVGTMMDWKFIKLYIIKPHWKGLTAGFVAVIFIGLADVLDPWPIKIVLDYVIGSKQMPEWISVFVDPLFGGSKTAILRLAAAAVIAIAGIGAAAFYFEKNLITKIGQSVV